MRLVPKLAIALLAGVFLVVAAFTAWRVRGEMQTFDRDIRRDHRIIGITAAAAVPRARSSEDAMRLVKRIDAARETVQIRFVSLAAEPRPALTPLVPLPALERPALGSWVQLERRLSTGARSVEHLVTYVPAPVADDADGAIELAEELTPRAGFISRGVANVLLSSAAMLVVCGAIVAAIGARLVGKPVAELIAAARRIGAGDFTALGGVRRMDEFGELARALSSMSTELEVARRKMSDEAEARLRALDQLRHAERLTTLGQLASVLAHEVGTPLNVIAGHAKLIATGKRAGESARESGSIIGSQCERMTQLVRSILDYARRKPPRRLWVDASDIAQQVCDLLSGLAAQRQVELHVDRARAAAHVFADPGQLQQALINLVMNAIQASGSGKMVALGIGSARPGSAKPGSAKPGSARPGCDQENCDQENRADALMPDGTYVVISVTDQGHGISAESSGHIFEPFFTTKANGEGTGLGLSIARDIVSEHGGFVEVSSEPERGSTFRIYLPRRDGCQLES